MTDQVNNQSYQDIIEKDIFDLLGMEGADPKKKDQLYQKILDTIYNRVVVRTLDNLKDGETEKFKEIFEKGDEKEIDKFFKSKGLNIKEMIAQEALVYKSELVSLVNIKKK